MATTASKPLIAKVLPSKGEPKSARRNALPEIEDLPALDAPSDADPFAGVSIEALGGGDPLEGVALASSPLAAAQPKRLNIDFFPFLVIAGVVLLLCLFAGGVYLLLPGGGASADWLKFMPNEAQMIVHMDVQAVRSSGLYEKITQVNPAIDRQIQQGLRGTSLRLEDIETVSVGGSLENNQKFVAVVRMNRSVSEDEMRGPKATRQESVGQFTLHNIDKQAAARIDDHTVVSGSPEMVKAVLSRNGPARLQPALQAAVDNAGFSSDVTMVMTLQGLPGVNRTVPGAPMDPSQVESLVISADLGSSIDLEATILFRDATVAGDLQQKIDDMMSGMRQNMGKMPPQAQEFKDVLDSLRISRSGRAITASVTVPQSLMDGAAKGMRMPALPAAGRSSSPARSTPPSIPSRRKTSGGDPNLPPTAPSRGLF